MPGLDGFWAAVDAQAAQLRTAATAGDVLRILATGGNPYGDPHISGAPGFYAGEGGEVAAALAAAGWTTAWYEAAYNFAMRAPDGTAITFCEGDVFAGDGLDRRRT